MPDYNLNVGYGRLAAQRIGLSPAGGKAFIVCPSTHPNFQTLQDIFVPDPSSTNRFFTTLAAALTVTTAARGDVIYVAEGYTETIVGAAGNGVTKAGIRIIGLGDGTNRPTITFTTSTAASFDITASNVMIQNIIFTNGIDAQTAMINVTGADVSFDNCDFNTNSATTGAVLGILTAATATRFKVTNSRFLGPAVNAGTTTTAQIKHEVGVDYEISTNMFKGKLTQAILNVTTVLGGAIHNNRFVIGTGTSAITMAAASTPFITNNRMNVASGTTPITAAAGFVAGNTYSAAAGVTAGTASTI